MRLRPPPPPEHPEDVPAELLTLYAEHWVSADDTGTPDYARAFMRWLEAGERWCEETDFPRDVFDEMRTLQPLTLGYWPEDPDGQRWRHLWADRAPFESGIL